MVSKNDAKETKCEPLIKKYEKIQNEGNDFEYLSPQNKLEKKRSMKFICGTQ